MGKRLSPRLRAFREFREQCTTQWGVEAGRRGLKLRRNPGRKKAIETDHGADPHHAYAWTAVDIGGAPRRCASCGEAIPDGECSVSPITGGYPYMAAWHVAWHVRHAPWSMLLRQPRGAFPHRTGAGRTKAQRELLAAVAAIDRSGAEVQAIPHDSGFMMLGPVTFPWKVEVNGPVYEPPTQEPLPVRWPWEKD